MAACREIRRRVDELAALPEVPAWARDHLAACAACAEALAAARLAVGLVRVSAVSMEPPPGFAARVGARLAGADRQAAGAELWRPAWGLVPTFAAILLGLLLLQPGPREPEPVSLALVEGITAGERLVLEPGELSPETILLAVLGRNGP